MNRWIIEMREYTYDIKYLKGKFNVVADTLSRPVRVVRQVVKPRNYLGLTLATVAEAQREDERWKKTSRVPRKGKITPKIVSQDYVRSICSGREGSILR